MAPVFIHLRNHSAFSLLEGAIKVKDLVALAVGEAMPALALTDSGNLFGALEFSLAAQKAGVQPIIGCQLAVQWDAPDPLRSAMPVLDQLVLLVQNETGYKNLLKLVSQSFLDETISQPYITRDFLLQHTGGLICLTGGAAGPLGRLLQAGQKDAAAACLDVLHDAFGDRLYIEIQRHNMPAELAIEEGLLTFAFDRHIPLIATNECFFAHPEMADAHDALLCIAGGRYVVEDDRRRVTAEHYFKSAREMVLLFADLPEAIANSVVIAQRCAYAPAAHDPLLPPFPSENGESEDVLLRRLAHDGLQARLDFLAIDNEAERKPYIDRLDFELAVIIQMGFPGYFLIVADFIQWAKAQNIPVGPGRGSGAGSVVAWALTITDLNPLQFGLLFERFLNPERVSMPDFDIDFCQERRDEVILYVQQKYGADRVAQIITFGELKARVVLRDVGRVMQLPYSQVDRICKLIPNNPANPVTLKQAIDGEVALQKMRDEDDAVAQLLTYGLQLEGLYRHASTHAAGVVIGDKPLVERVPLYRDPKSSMLVTQFDMKDAETAGLVKFDFLGLKTLTVLQKAIELLAARGVVIDLQALPLTDDTTFAMLARGESSGVFQLESSGMRDVLRRLRPNRFEDIIALVALYRPGPMDNIPTYIAVKDGVEQPDYLHASLEPVLRETYGIMIYQEQVMQVAQILSGYSLGAADLLRRAMGKKIKEEMDAQRQNFVDGAVANNVNAYQAAHIFDQVEKFAGYGFNKSHAAAYALIAWQTAYLKANYPVEFLAALMTLDLGNTDKLAHFRQECLRLSIPLLPPDVNHSTAHFAVETIADGTLAIRYALAALKGVGEGFMQQVVHERQQNGPYLSMADFCCRTIMFGLNKKQIESLIAAGALDNLHKSRQGMMNAVEFMLKFAGVHRDEVNSNQASLFGDSAAVPPPAPDEKRDWPPVERLKYEFDAVGFYLSAHPLDGYARALKRLNVVRSVDIAATVARGGTQRIKLAGMVTSMAIKTSARGNKMAFVQLSDTSGAYEVTLFSETLNASRDLLQEGRALLLQVDAQMNDENIRLTGQGVSPLDEATAHLTDGIMVYIADMQGLQATASVLQAAKAGRAEILLSLPVDDTSYADIQLPQRYFIEPGLRHDLGQISNVVVEDL